MTTTAELKRGLEIMMLVTEVIHDAGRIPSGMLYGGLMHGLTLAGYESMIAQVVGTGLVRKEGHELVWIG